MRRVGRRSEVLLVAAVACVGAILSPRPLGAVAADFSYAALDTILTRYLDGGRVDYGALARDRGPLERFLAATRAVHPDDWPRADAIAFWINVYNARVLDGVVRRPGLKSVLDVGKVVGIPTLGFFREKSRSGGREVSLNDIEHEILRREFRDPRIHFVINCASTSCPELPARPVSGAALDSLLDAATRAFLLDRTKNDIGPGPELRVSALFKWYRADFDSAAGDLRGFIQRYWSGTIREDAAIRFLDYDWTLNGQW
jgi:hypothetical protein